MLRSALLALLLTISLSSCSALAPLAKDALLGGAQKGISVDANAGKAEGRGDDSVAQNANTAVSGQVNSERTEEQTYQAPVEQVVNEAGLDWWVLALIVLLAGWAIPAPGEMLERTVAIFRPTVSRRKRLGPE